MSNEWNLPPISLSTRCDKKDCSASANVRAVLRTGDLYFCGHHYVTVQDSIYPHAVYIHDERTRGPVINTTAEFESFGRLTLQRSLTSLDPCRWCMLRLELRRATFKSAMHGVLGMNYFLCPHCDETEADMSDWIRPAA